MAKKSGAVWVTGNRTEGYKVKSEGASRAASTHDTQRDAIKAGRDLAESKATELRVQDQHGRIRETLSYGNDPCPPKDKR
jgi:hypothetical protein